MRHSSWCDFVRRARRDDPIVHRTPPMRHPGGRSGPRHLPCPRLLMQLGRQRAATAGIGIETSTHVRSDDSFHPLSRIPHLGYLGKLVLDSAERLFYTGFTGDVLVVRIWIRPPISAPVPGSECAHRYPSVPLLVAPPGHRTLLAGALSARLPGPPGAKVWIGAHPARSDHARTPNDEGATEREEPTNARDLPWL